MTEPWEVIIKGGGAASSSHFDDLWTLSGMGVQGWLPLFSSHTQAKAYN